MSAVKGRKSHFALLVRAHQGRFQILMGRKKDPKAYNYGLYVCPGGRKQEHELSRVSTISRETMEEVAMRIYVSYRMGFELPDVRSTTTKIKTFHMAVPMDAYFEEETKELHHTRWHDIEEVVNGAPDEYSDVHRSAVVRMYQSNWLTEPDDAFVRELLNLQRKAA